MLSTLRHGGARAVALLDQLTRLGAALAATGLAAIVLISCAEVAARYLMGAPTRWANDAVQMLLAGCIFLMLPEVTRSGGHVAITLLRDRLGRRTARYAAILIGIIAAIASGWAGWIAGLETLRLFRAGITTLTVVALPKWPVAAAICSGFILSALQFLRAAAAPATAAD